MHFRRFHVERVDADVPDVRAREQHKLTGVGRVGQDFLVSVVVVVVVNVVQI